MELWKSIWQIGFIIITSTIIIAIVYCLFCLISRAKPARSRKRRKQMSQLVCEYENIMDLMNGNHNKEWCWILFPLLLETYSGQINIDEESQLSERESLSLKLKLWIPI